LQLFLQKYSFSKKDGASLLPQLYFFPVTVQQSLPLSGYAGQFSYPLFGQLLYSQQVILIKVKVKLNLKNIKTII